MQATLKLVEACCAELTAIYSCFISLFILLYQDGHTLDPHFSPDHRVLFDLGIMPRRNQMSYGWTFTAIQTSPKVKWIQSSAKDMD
jgi:hypothetical protein